MTKDRTALTITIGLLVVGGSLAAVSLYRSSQQDLRVLVSIEVGPDTMLSFEAEHPNFGSDPWMSYRVRVDIGTDDFIQTVTLHDRYALEGGALGPVPTASDHDYRLSDTAPSSATFEVLIPELSTGEHRASLTFPVLVEPAEGLEDLYETRETLAVLTFVYQVFRSSPKGFYCSQADQMLQGSHRFDPDAFIDTGVGVLNENEIARIEEAHAEFMSAPGDDINPAPFFEAIEDICDVTYRERWQTWVN